MLPGKANGALCTPAASSLVRHSTHPGTEGSTTVITASVFFSVKKPAHSTCYESELTESRICFWLSIKRASLVAQLVKNRPAMQETPVRFLGLEYLLEKGMATQSSISWLENPRGERSLVCYSPWGHQDSDTTEWLSLSLPSQSQGAYT